MVWQTLLGVHAVHSSSRIYMTNESSAASNAIVEAPCGGESTHPVVTTTLSGRKALYINKLYTVGYVYRYRMRILTGY